MDISWVKEELKGLYASYEEARNRKIGPKMADFRSESSKNMAISHISGQIAAFERVLTKMGQK